MTTLTIGSGLGGIVLLNTKQCLRDRLHRAADAIGCGRFVPAQPRTTTVLRDVMKTVADSLYGRKRKQPNVVRQLDSADSFEVCRVLPGKTENEYVQLFAACINPYWDVSVLQCQTGAATAGSILTELADAVARQRDYLPSAVVGQIVVKVLRHFRCTPLKDDGGAWFMQGQHLDAFRQFAATVRGGSGDGPRFTVTQFEIASDPDTVVHVMDRLEQEVLVAMKDIMDDVLAAGGGMADRSANVRTAKANAFLDKVRSYERALNKPMPELTQAIEQVKQAVAVTRLLAASV